MVRDLLYTYLYKKENDTHDLCIGTSKSFLDIVISVHGMFFVEAFNYGCVALVFVSSMVALYHLDVFVLHASFWYVFIDAFVDIDTDGKTKNIVA